MALVTAELVSEVRTVANSGSLNVTLIMYKYDGAEDIPRHGYSEAFGEEGATF